MREENPRLPRVRSLVIHQVFSFNFVLFAIVVSIKPSRIMLLLILYCRCTTTMSCLCILYALQDPLSSIKKMGIFLIEFFINVCAGDRQERFILIIIWRLLDHFSHTSDGMTWSIFLLCCVATRALRAVQWIINFNVCLMFGVGWRCEREKNYVEFINFPWLRNILHRKHRAPTAGEWVERPDDDCLMLKLSVTKLVDNDCWLVSDEDKERMSLECI